MIRPTRIFVAVMAVSLFVPAPEFARARPMYKKVWDEMYRERLPVRTKAGCNLCHPAKSKKKRSDYGKALEKELDEKNVKDRERIRKALKKIEDKLPIPLKPGKD